MRTGLCDWCGEGFVDRSPAQKRRWCCDNCRKRGTEAQRESVCAVCGVARSSTKHGRCRECFLREKRERRDGKWRYIMVRWNEGASMPDIARELGTTANSLGSDMWEMRREGWPLRFRYRTSRGRRVAAGV